MSCALPLLGRDFNEKGVLQIWICGWLDEDRLEYPIDVEVGVPTEASCILLLRHHTEPTPFTTQDCRLRLKKCTYTRPDAPSEKVCSKFKNLQHFYSNNGGAEVTRCDDCRDRRNTQKKSWRLEQVDHARANGTEVNNQPNLSSMRPC